MHVVSSQLASSTICPAAAAAALHGAHFASALQRLIPPGCLLHSLSLLLLLLLHFPRPVWLIFADLAAPASQIARCALRTQVAFRPAPRTWDDLTWDL